MSLLAKIPSSPFYQLLKTAVLFRLACVWSVLENRSWRGGQGIKTPNWMIEWNGEPENELPVLESDLTPTWIWPIWILMTVFWQLWKYWNHMTWASFTRRKEGNTPEQENYFLSLPHNVSASSTNWTAEADNGWYTIHPHKYTSIHRPTYMWHCTSQLHIPHIIYIIERSIWSS